MSEDKLYLYDILNIDENASKAEIKDSYRRLAHKHHPDKGGDEEVFKEIKVAYETLIDPKKRAQYHLTGDYDGVPESTLTRGEQLVIETFALIVNKDDFSGDYVVKARDMFEEAMRKMVSQREENRHNYKRSQILLKRIKKVKDTDHEDNLWSQVLESRIANLQSDTDRITIEHDACIEALAILDKYHDQDPDEEPVPRKVDEIINLKQFLNSMDSPEFNPERDL